MRVTAVTAINAAARTDWRNYTMDLKQVYEYRIEEPVQRIAQFFTGLKDKNVLNRSYSCVSSLRDAIQSDRYKLRDIYTEYINSISTDEMAVSLETAFCGHLPPKVRNMSSSTPSMITNSGWIRRKHFWKLTISRPKI